MMKSDNDNADKQVQVVADNSIEEVTNNEDVAMKESVMGEASNVKTLQQSRQTNPFIATPTTFASNVTTTAQDGINNNNSSSCYATTPEEDAMVEETTARYAMVESLRSLPGAFRVTPNFTPKW